MVRAFTVSRYTRTQWSEGECSTLGVRTPVVATTPGITIQISTHSPTTGRTRLLCITRNACTSGYTPADPFV